MIATRQALLWIALAWPCAVAAQTPTPPIQLDLPIACTPGTDCFIMNYFDHDEGPGRRDYQCRHLTYDKHTGTDFALADPAAMAAGVAVLAAAPGRVMRVRDGMDDVNILDIKRQTIAGRECGNAVIIQHAAGWTTQYCHMRRGSVAVREGQQVAGGDKLGLVGMSGETQFPHVHLSVRQANKTVDPFVGPLEDIHTTCGPGETPLWSKPVLEKLAYRPVVIYLAGFVGGTTSNDEIMRLRLKPERTLSASLDAISFYFWIIGLAKNDHVELRLIGPNGRTVVERSIKEPSDRFSYVSFLNAKHKGSTFPAGEYRGEIVIRPGSGSSGATIHRVETVELR